MLPPAAAAPPADFDLQAHRGGRGETTEESLRAFAKSLELGVNTLELDIVVTKDGQPLVWHDPVIDPTKCADTAPAFPGDPQYPYVGNTSAAPRGFVDVILDAVRRARKVDEVEIQSFDWRTLPMVRAAEPPIPLVALWDETTYLPGSPWLGGVNPAVVPDPITGATMVGANYPTRLRGAGRIGVAPTTGLPARLPRPRH